MPKIWHVHSVSAICYILVSCPLSSTFSNESANYHFKCNEVRKRRISKIKSKTMYSICMTYTVVCCCTPPNVNMFNFEGQLVFLIYSTKYCMKSKKRKLTNTIPFSMFLLGCTEQILYFT